jgi:hypothetical protein
MPNWIEWNENSMINRKSISNAASEDKPFSSIMNYKPYSMMSTLQKESLKYRSNEMPADWEISVYPNPTNGILQIDITGGDIPSGATVEIFAAGGNSVGKWTDISPSNTLNISTLPAGTYLVCTVLNGKYVHTKKIVKD